MEQTALIGNHRYTVLPLGSSQARALLVRLTKAYLPVMGQLLRELGGVNADQAVNIQRLSQMDVKHLASTLDRLAQSLSAEDLEECCKVLGSVTMLHTADGGQVPLDLERQELHFRGGNLLGMFRWLGFALRVQYSDFFVGIASALAGGSERPGEKTS